LLLDADVAAVVVCPEQWEPEQLKEVVQLVRANGSIVIFDEVKSGLRVGPKGVWHKINIIPDLLCIAKGLANGYPLAALVGSAELMKFVPGTKLSSTYATDCVSLAAAIAAEKLLQKRSLWPSWEQSAKQILSAVEGEIISNHGADRLRIFSEINTLYLHTPGINPADDPFRHTLIRGLAKKGVFTTGHWIIMSDAHQPHHVAAIEAALIDVIREWLSS
jgi:glutamate-1-semialdehyde 2,1-aminomutase